MKKYSYLVLMIFSLLICQISMSENKCSNKCCGLNPCIERLTVTSPTIKSCCQMDIKHVFNKCSGQNVSPELSIKNLPCCTKSVVIIAVDPDAPNPKTPRPNPWIHWLAYDLPTKIPNMTIPEGVSITNFGGKQGKNDFGNNNYDGPCPPKGSGKHRYFFKVKALNIPTLNLPEGASIEQLKNAMGHHIVGEGELIGTYEIK